MTNKEEPTISFKRVQRANHLTMRIMSNQLDFAREGEFAGAEQLTTNGRLRRKWQSERDEMTRVAHRAQASCAENGHKVVERVKEWNGRFREGIFTGQALNAISKSAQIVRHTKVRTDHAKQKRKRIRTHQARSKDKMNSDDMILCGLCGCSLHWREKQTRKRVKKDIESISFACDEQLHAKENLFTTFTVVKIHQTASTTATFYAF